MKLVTIVYETVKMALGARHIPEGWEAIGTHAVRNDETWASGVLLRNKKAGIYIYRLFDGTALISVDQKIAHEYASKEG